VWGKVYEEMDELVEEVKAGSSKEKLEGEFGDILFALINYARFLGVNPEDALERTNKKFIRRFQYLERETQKDGKKLSEMTLAEMDVYWEQSKKND
jgi:XTP/dITP diphosphohydrolase